MASNNVSAADFGDLKPESAWGGASYEVSREYLYKGKSSLKIVLPVRDSGVWFVPEKTDWSSSGELEFTLYNPWNDPVEPEVFIRSGKDGAVHRLPENCTIPSGMLPVPREAQVTFRLDLSDPQIQELIDVRNVTGVLIGQGRPGTTIFLDKFRVKTKAEIVAEKRQKLGDEVKRATQRIQASASPSFYEKETKETLAALASLLEGEESPGEDKWRPVVTKANELASVLEGIAGVKESLGDILVKPVSSMIKVFRDEPIPAKASPFPLEGAGNERVSFQVVVIPRSPLLGVKLEASDMILKGSDDTKISRDQITVNPVGYVEVLSAFYYLSSRLGWWPDPLMLDKPVDVVGRIQPFWITVHIPPDQEPGEYVGKISVSADGQPAQTLEFSINVWAFSLPVRGEMKTLFSFTYKPEDERIRRMCYDTLLENRISPVNIYINGTAQFGDQPDRSDLRYCLDRGMNTIVLWNPYNINGEFPYEYDEAYLSRMNSFIREYEPQLRKEGAWEMSMVLGFDEITHQDKEFSDRASKGAGEFAKALRKEFPDLPLANIGGPPLPMQLIGPGNINIPIPSIASPKWADQFRALKESASPFYFYWVYGDPSFMLDLPGIAPRALSWIAYKYGATGISYYSIIRDASFSSAPTGVDWHRSRFNIEGTNRIGRNGDGIMVYPSQDGSILSSIRLANTRDGIQDYEYLCLLKKALGDRKDEEAEKLLAIPDDLVTYDSYTKDQETLLSYRRQVAQAILRLQNSKNEN